MKSMIVGSLLVIFATPTLAAEFYIVKDSKTQECNVVEGKPAQGSDQTLVDGDSYASRDKAMNVMSTEAISGKCPKNKK